MIDEDMGVIDAELDPEQRANFMEVLSKRSSIIRDGFAHWNAILEVRPVPLRSEFDPFKVPLLLPDIVMHEV